MCSSSLTAIHLACESLALGTCTAAIAGGVNLSLHPNKYLALTQGRFLSSAGRCESFGDGGDGYVPGEGVGAVVLKRLDRAVADGDHIYGVIRGSALNHGGKTNGYTVPNPQAQTAVIRRALEKAGVEPRQISYVEAHGTGTKLGDPIEIAALSNAFRAETPETGFCAIGSVKSNIGHCESAAGIAGLTKVLLQMQHRRLVPSLHSSVLNPGIDFGASPFTVQRRLDEWRRPLVDEEEMPRIAGLSSFGAGGSNAHFIVEEYDAPQHAKVDARGPVRLSLLGARRCRSREGGCAASLRRSKRWTPPISPPRLMCFSSGARPSRCASPLSPRIATSFASGFSPRYTERQSMLYRGVRRAGEGEVSPGVTRRRRSGNDCVGRGHAERMSIGNGCGAVRRRAGSACRRTPSHAKFIGCRGSRSANPRTRHRLPATRHAVSMPPTPLPLLFTPDWQPYARPRVSENPKSRRLARLLRSLRISLQLPTPRPSNAMS